MEQDDNSKEIMTRYLLGLLSEKEQEQLEAGFVADQHVFEELLSVEDDLIDDYVSGRLSERYRERFEGYFLRVAERRERLTFALALKLYTEESTVGTEPTSAARPWWQRVLTRLRR